MRCKKCDLRLLPALTLAVLISLSSLAQAGAPPELKLFPAMKNQEVLVGQQLRFAAIFQTPETLNRWVSATPKLPARWSATGGSIDRNGLFSARKRGYARVEVRIARMTKSVRFRIVDGANYRRAHAQMLNHPSSRFEIYPSAHRNNMYDIRAGAAMLFATRLTLGRLTFSPPAAAIRWSMPKGGAAGKLYPNGVFQTKRQASSKRIEIRASWGRRTMTIGGHVSTLGTPRAGTKLFHIAVGGGGEARIYLGQTAVIKAHAIRRDGSQTRNFNCFFKLSALKGPRGTHRIPRNPGSIQIRKAPCQMAFTPRQAGVYYGTIRSGLQSANFRILVAHRGRRAPVARPPKARPPKARPPKARPPKARPPKARPPRRGPTQQQINARRAADAKRKAAALRRCRASELPVVPLPTVNL